MIHFLLLAQSLYQFPDTYSSISASKDHLAFCAYDGDVKILSTASHKQIQSIHLQGGARFVQWTRDGEELLIGGQSEVGLFSRTGKALKTIRVNAFSGLSALATSRGNGEVALGFNTGLVELWDVRNGKVRTARVGAGCNCIEFSRDGKQLLSGNSNGVTVLDVSRLGQVAKLKCNFGQFAYVWSISPAGRHKFFVSLSNGQIDELRVSRGETWSVRALTKLNGECPKSISTANQAVDVVTQQDRRRTNRGKNELVELSHHGKQLGKIRLAGYPSAVSRFEKNLFILLEDGRIVKAALNGAKWNIEEVNLTPTATTANLRGL